MISVARSYDMHSQPLWPKENSELAPQLLPVHLHNWNNQFAQPVDYHLALQQQEQQQQQQQQHHHHRQLSQQSVTHHHGLDYFDLNGRASLGLPIQDKSILLALPYTSATVKQRPVPPSRTRSDVELPTYSLNNASDEDVDDEFEGDDDENFPSTQHGLGITATAAQKRRMKRFR